MLRGALPEGRYLSSSLLRQLCPEIEKTKTQHTQNHTANAFLEKKAVAVSLQAWGLQGVMPEHGLAFFLT